MNKFLSEKIKFLSFILIIFVVFIHASNYKKAAAWEVTYRAGYTWPIEAFVSDGVTRVAVPLFFLVSGYLFFLNFNNTRSEIVDKLKKRLKTLLLPYLLWSAGVVLFYFVIQAIPKVGVFFSKELIRNYSTSELLKTIFINPINFQLWFLRDLMVLVLVSPVLYYLIKYLRLTIVILFAFLWLFDIRLQVLSTESLLYFTLGAYLSFNKINLYFSRLVKYGGYLIIAWLLVLILRITLIEMKLITVFENMLLHKFGIMLGLIALWEFYDKMQEGKDMKNYKIYNLLSFSFFVYLFHEPILTIIQKVMLAVTGKSNTMILIDYFSSVIITIIISLIVGYLFKKVLPSVYALSTGNR